ncbi:glycoside hydrolase family 28 protein [Plicaturopsis crispa FD-325 SS-3]|uniref:galacturonan 1,4-alpha-galacturonidase n=1 Tax=Plicaturopsis crispa FD-325 SS-3 TaxID=944288 RepID=A0A0C9SKL9_PLICR|nr:glycoside hydrolase family 28 protein [Plicaturopsis crispa FD-325 SS-3]
MVLTLLAAWFFLSVAAASFSPLTPGPQKRCVVHALGDGQDDGPSILAAFQNCSTNARIELIGNYTVGTALNTTDLKNVEIFWTGNITYTPNITYWSPASFFLTYQNATTSWLLGGENIYLHGGGTLDSNGQIWWDYMANNPGSGGVAGGSSRAFARPVPLTVFNAKNVLIHGLRSVNSPFWHNFVVGSENVVYDDITVRSVSTNTSVPAANTDDRSSHITVKNSNIENSDDCVSFKPNSTFITVSNLKCNGSHGISYAGETDIVANVHVSNISMMNAQNGARIKVFGGSNDSTSVSGGGTGYVQNITYENFFVENVDRPILLTQCYNTPAAQCQEFPANLTISDVHFINVHGASSGSQNATVATLQCSNECEDITAAGTNLTAPGYADPVYLCADLADESLLDFKCSEVSS